MCRGRVCWGAAAHDGGDLKVGVLEVVGAVTLVEELERAGEGEGEGEG